MAKENKSAGGFGESKTFAAPEGTFDDGPVYHLDGKPIPVELAHAIPYALTDEGKAEAAARPGPEPSVEFILDETNPTRHAQRFKEAGLQEKPWDVNNELRRLMDVNRPEGHKCRWLGDDVNAKLGTRGYQVVKDEKGEAVRFGNSVLGSMPEPMARAMEKDYEDKSPKAGDASRKHMEQLESGVVDAGVPAGFFKGAEAQGIAGLRESKGGFRD